MNTQMYSLVCESVFIRENYYVLNEEGRVWNATLKTGEALGKAKNWAVDKYHKASTAISNFANSHSDGPVARAGKAVWEPTKKYVVNPVNKYAVQPVNKAVVQPAARIVKGAMKLERDSDYQKRRDRVEGAARRLIDRKLRNEPAGAR